MNMTIVDTNMVKAWQIIAHLYVSRVPGIRRMAIELLSRGRLGKTQANVKTYYPLTLQTYRSVICHVRFFFIESTACDLFNARDWLHGLPYSTRNRSSRVPIRRPVSLD